MLIGVSGANQYARDGGTIFATQDHQLFLPRDPGLEVDLTQVMAGFTFARVARRERAFVVAGVRLPVARLSDIVASKAAAGRPKDRLFLAAHAEGLRDLIVRRRRPPPRRRPSRR